jgi:hypothetical protein
MLVTFGLSRLEASLVDDTVSAADVAAALDRAKADCARPALPAPRAITAREDCYIDGYAHQETTYVPFRGDRDEPVLAEAGQRSPSRIYVHRPANPEFRPSWHADRV